MMRPGKLTDQDKDAIREAHAAGTSADDLAARYGVSRQAIYYHVSTAVGHRKRRAATRTSRTPTRSRAAIEDQRPYRDSTYGYIPSICVENRCGQAPPRDEAALPLVVYGGQVPAVEFCSWHCLSRHAIRRELAGADAA